MQKSRSVLVMSRRWLIEVTSIFVVGAVVNTSSALAVGEAAGVVERLETQTQPLETTWSREPLLVRVDDLPRGATYISMRRVRFEPEASLAESPIDGPKVILVEAGSISIELSRSGAAVYRGENDDKSAERLAPGETHALIAGDLALIPAAVPVRFANVAASPAQWLQIQAETPATECPCGADLTGIRTELLDSMTLETPLAVPAEIEISVEQRDPGAALKRPSDSAPVLFSSVSQATANLVRETSGAVVNRSSEPMFLYMLSFRPAGTTT